MIKLTLDLFYQPGEDEDEDFYDYIEEFGIDQFYEQYKDRLIAYTKRGYIDLSEGDEG